MTQNTDVRSVTETPKTLNSDSISAASHVHCLVWQVGSECCAWLILQLRGERKCNVPGFSYQEVGRVIYISTAVLVSPGEKQL